MGRPYPHTKRPDGGMVARLARSMRGWPDDARNALIEAVIAYCEETGWPGLAPGGTRCQGAGMRQCDVRPWVATCAHCPRAHKMGKPATESKN